MQKLLRSFYDRDTVTVARELLGKFLVHRVAGVELIGRIVEVEAYLGPHDLASHSSKGLTEREGHGAAVLLRALEPVQNISGRTNGPGLLSRTMQIDRQHNGYDLLRDDFFIAAGNNSAPIKIVKRPR